MKKVYNLLTLILLMAIAVPLTARAATTDVLTASDFAATGTTYTDFSGVRKNTAVYAGQSAKNSSGAIQLRSKNSNSGIVSTTSGGKLKSVKINVSSGSNTVQVYGKNTAYSSASDLYNASNQGTRIGTTSTTGTISVNGDYEYVGIRSAEGAIYLSSIEIEWETTSSTVPDAPTITATAGGSSLSNGGTTTALPTVAISFPSGSTNVYYNVGTSASIADPTSDSNTGSLTAAGNVNYTFTAGNTYYIKARSYNAQGYSETTTSFSFTYNLPSPPSAPSITGVTDGETVSSAPNLSVSFPSGADHVYYTIGIGSQPSDPTSETNDGSFTSAGTIPASAFTTSGTYYIKAIAHNAGGYSSVASISFTYEKPNGATIVWDDNGSDSSTAITSSSIADYYTEGEEYVSSISGISRVYKGKVGLKFGSSSSIGSFTVNLASEAQLNATKLIISAQSYADNTSTVLNVNGTDITLTGGQTLTDYEIDLDGSTLTSITFSSTSSNPRLYLKAVTIVAAPATQCAAPTLSPAGGESSATAVSYIGATTVTPSTTTDGATFNYTIDGGSEQTGSSITLPATLGDHTIVVWASKDGLDPSEHVTAYYKSVKPAAPTASPGNAGSTYNIQSATSVTLASANGGTIYYTTDGSTPTSSSSVYSSASAITVNGGETIKAIAVVNGVSSDVASYEYVLALNPLAVSVSPAADTYEGDTEITITTADGYGTVSIYYTTDGTDPASSATRVTYTAPFTLSHSATPYTLRVYAEDSRPGSTGKSATFTGSYTINKATNVYKRIQNATELAAAAEAGARVVIGAVDGSAIMGPTGGNTYFASITTGYNYSESNKTITITSASPQYLTLGGTSGAYTLSNGGYYAAPNTATSGASVQWSTTPVTNSISISPNETAQIIADGGTRILGYNSTYTRFATYSSGSTYDCIAIYAQFDETTCANVSYSPASGESFVGSLDVTLNSSDNATIAYTVTNVATSAVVASGEVISGQSIKLIDESGNAQYQISASATREGLDDSDQTTAAYYAGKPNLQVTPSHTGEPYRISSPTEISMATSDGATIYYTTDGSTPTTSSTAYTAPITVNSNVTYTVLAIKAFTVGSKNYQVTSDLLECQYEFGLEPPTFSPEAGSYTANSLDVTLSSTTAGATIYYTTDGTTPSSSSTAYTGPITLTHTTTVKAIAVYNSYTSEVASAKFTLIKGTTTTIWSENWTGETKDTQPASVTSGGGTGTATYSYSGSSSLKAEALAAGASPELLIAKGGGSFTATINLPSGVKSPLTLKFLQNYARTTVSTSTTGASVGTLSWTEATKQATCAVTIPNGATELELVFSNSLSNNVRVDNFQLLYENAVVSDPEITPESGTYDNDVQVTIASDEDAIIYYSTDGTDPDNNSIDSGVGTVTLTVSSNANGASGTTVKAVAYGDDSQSAVISANYVLKAATPNPTGLEEFNFTNDFNYKVTSATTGATIYYTTDGSTPTTSSASVASGANIHIDGSFTLRMVAGKTGYEMSDVKVVTFTKELVSAPFFTLAEGTYTDAQKTYIMEETDNATIYYTMTTDGSEPATPDVSSTLYVYGGGVNLPIGTIWIKAIATDGQGNFSTITEAHYTCVQGKLHLMPSPSSGNYVDPIQVTIREEHVAGEALVYYTLDGSDPNSSATAIQYTKGSTITIDHSCTLRVYGIDNENDYSSQDSYVIGVLEPEFSPLSGSTITYRGDNNSIEIYTLTHGAKIYYTFTTDGSEPAVPDNTCTLYTGSNTELHGLTAGTESSPNVYRIKAIAYVGNTASTVHEGIYYVKPLTGNGLENVAAMVNHDPSSTPLSFENPVQIVFMDRYLNGGDGDSSNDTIQYAYVRDNSGYGQIYFGNPRQGYGAGKTHFEMGDWIDGTQISGPLTVWSNGFPDHMQMSRTSSYGVSWPTTRLGHRDIIPESTLIRIINAGTDTDNLWAHYVHLPNLRVDAESLSWSSERLMGTITSMATGVTGTYYDSFYLHREKDAAWWNAQPVNRSYDITGLVCYYNQLVPQGYPSNFEIAPITFEYTDNPHITPPGGKKAQALAVTIDFYDDVPEADKDGVSFYYKTSDMEDFELYTGPFTVRSTTTVQAYSSRISPLTGDELRSVITSETYEFENVEAPVISPASQTFQASSPVNVTISCETGNATIWYTTDGTNPLSASGTRQKYIPGETVITVTSNTTVRAIATHGSVSSVEADARTYTLVKNNGVEYELVTSASQLIPGRAYVIVNRANNVALNITQTEINRRAVAVTLVDDGNKVQVNDDVAVFTLGGSQGAYTFFTENGADAAANGYLYTQTMTNTLLTRAAVGSDGFAEADITIDATTHDASIEFGGANRYLYYYKRDNLFSTYNKSTQQPVALYWRAVTDLADIVNNGTVSEQYVVNDDLVGVFVPQGDQNVLYAKDFNKSRRPSVNEHGAKDYIGEVMGPGKPDVKLAADYDQSTWVKIVGLANPSSYEGKTIIGGTLVVTLTDKVNPTITKTNESSEPSIGEAVSYSRQTYIPASFMGEYMTAGHGIEYFFVVPKPQEYVRITAAVYDGTKFIVPEPSDDENKAELTGGFDVDWTLMTPPSSLEAGNEYDLEGIVEAKTGGGAGARRKAMSASSTLKLVPTNIQAGGVLTGIDGVSASRKAVRTRYYNISGMESDKPFQGVVNIIVVTYDDGSTFSRKVLF